MSPNNTHFKEITSSNYGLLGSYSVVNYLDGYYFKNIDLISTFNYPTTTYGGPLTGSGPASLSADGYVSFDSISAGGPISNYTYDDFSGINSKINLGLFFCNPTIVISLSSYDESVSPITTIIYEEYSKPIVNTPSLNVTTISSVQVFNLASQKNTPIYLYPRTSEKYTTIYEGHLSVIKLDATMNTFTLVASVLQCGILDVFDTANILNSQMLDDPKKILLTFENRRTKTIYNNIINTDIPFYLLTGGEVVELETEEVQPDTVFELEPANEVFQTSQLRQVATPTIPEPKPKINPITPNLAEYFYRGERGIRVRPLLTRLLPGQTFYYARPESGLVLLSGGAPYYPGLGILFNLEFRIVRGVEGGVPVNNNIERDPSLAPPVPTPTPTTTQTPTPTITPTPTPTPTITPTPTPTIGCQAGFVQAGNQSYPAEYDITLGNGIGTVVLNYNSQGSPDRFMVIYNGVTAIDTSYVGDNSYAPQLNAAIGAITPITSPGIGSASFIKSSTIPTAKVLVYAPLSNSSWSFTLNCPQ